MAIIVTTVQQKRRSRDGNGVPKTGIMLSLKLKARKSNG